MLRWRKVENEQRPSEPYYTGYLGKVPIACIEDRTIYNNSFEIHINLSPKDWEKWPDFSFITDYKDNFRTLDAAKRAAERLVAKWVRDAGLKASAAR